MAEMNSTCPLTGAPHAWVEGPNPFQYHCDECEVTLDQPDQRPSWPEVWMDVARTICQRSIDPAFKVGAIVVADDNTQVLSVGYNGMWKGGPNFVESLERGKSGTIHAELNALLKCDFSFPKPKHMYVTHSPCRDCSKLIVNGGVCRVVYGVPYRDMSGVQLLRSVGVEVLDLEEAVERARRRV